MRCVLILPFRSPLLTDDAAVQPDIFAGHGPHSLLVQTLEKSDAIVGILAEAISRTSQNSPLNLQQDWSGHYYAGTRWMREVGRFFRIHEGEALSCRWRDARLDERHAVIEVLWTALARLVKGEMGPLSLVSSDASSSSPVTGAD